jgi:hypothetical protein
MNILDRCQLTGATEAMQIHLTNERLQIEFEWYERLWAVRIDPGAIGSNSTSVIVTIDHSNPAGSTRS